MRPRSGRRASSSPQVRPPGVGSGGEAPEGLAGSGCPTGGGLRPTGRGPLGRGTEFSPVLPPLVEGDRGRPRPRLALRLASASRTPNRREPAALRRQPRRQRMAVRQRCSATWPCGYCWLALEHYGKDAELVLSLQTAKGAAAC